MEKTVFLSITQADKNEMIAKAIIGREQEIFSYELNIENYERTLANPDLDPGFRKRLSDLLITENGERAKSLAIYESLKAAIPPADLDAAVAAAKLALKVV